MDRFVVVLRRDADVGEYTLYGKLFKTEEHASSVALACKTDGYAYAAVLPLAGVPDDTQPEAE